MKTKQLTRRNFLKVGAFGVVGLTAYQIMPFEQAFAAPARKRTLVVYFSMPETTNPNNMTSDEANSTVVVNGKVLGNTQYFATVIQETTGADIFRIEPAIAYPTDHAALVSRAKDEQDKNARPAMKAKIDNLAQYDVIYLGYPTWYYQLPMILRTFLEQHDLSGKMIVPFNTHGGSGFLDTVSVVAQLQPNAIVRNDGLSISRDRIENAMTDIVTWLNKLNIHK